MDLLRKETNLDEDTEIIYTSGSSESNNLAIKGIAQTYKENGKHIISTFLEHSSVSSPLTYLKEQGYEIDIVNIKKQWKIAQHLHFFRFSSKIGMFGQICPEAQGIFHKRGG